MNQIVIFGTGLIAEVAHFYFTHDSDYEVVAFTNGEEFITENSFFLGLPVVPFERVEIFYPPQNYKIFIALGYKNRNKIRAQRYLQAKKKNYQFATYISSKASYYNTPVGENCFILENNVIQPFVNLGNNVILWSGNHIGHHSTIEDHCFLSSHTVISGNVTIGSNGFVGVNATVRDNVTLGKNVIIGANALVMENCPDQSVFVAEKTPHRVITRDII